MGGHDFGNDNLILDLRSSAVSPWVHRTEDGWRVGEGTEGGNVGAPGGTIRKCNGTSKDGTRETCTTNGVEKDRRVKIERAELSLH